MAGTDRTLVADGLHNARDLGGLPTRDGGRTPTGRFFRSESPDRLTTGGWGAVRHAGIRTVVDLRGAAERADDTGDRPDWLTTVAVDLDDLDDVAFWADFTDDGRIGTPLYYGPFLARKPDRVVAALRAIVHAAPGGVLFHCAAGRDRTGIVALVLLSLAGVGPEDVVDDYLVTIATGPARFAALGVPSPEDAIAALCAEHGTTVTDAVRATVDGFDVAAFVRHSGLDAPELEALRTFRAQGA
ncbi:tyrosine-protein phosphatase [Curtobacterium sp. 9128]|uniref:tyrosine-protein phosphatase n=1 Tax=Curtobacterium sp. 9128 TaxID=1793722 RepID=UPI0011A07060|nr:tyrosine-protein phosphatase [Curtobacterium sp. 9128]